MPPCIIPWVTRYILKKIALRGFWPIDIGLLASLKSNLDFLSSICYDMQLSYYMLPPWDMSYLIGRKQVGSSTKLVKDTKWRRLLKEAKPWKLAKEAKPKGPLKEVKHWRPVRKLRGLFVVAFSAWFIWEACFAYKGRANMNLKVT